MSEAWHKYGQWTPYRNEDELQEAICILNTFIQVMVRKVGKPRNLEWKTEEDRVSFTAEFNSGGDGKIRFEGYDPYLWYLKEIHEPITQEMIDNGFLGEG